MMRVGSLFAGIGGFDLGFERAGFIPAWQCEIDPACLRVLARHWPDVERHNDITQFDGAPADIITFGSPCQDLSVAGRRSGLDGAKSSLFFEATRIIRAVRPELAVWENVPGALSCNQGRDFARAIDELADCGAVDIAWRVLDAQFFGVAQRRRRLFVVADFRGRRAGEILFESTSGGGNSAASGKAGQEVAFTLTASVRGTGDGHGNAWNSTYIAKTLQAHAGRLDAETEDVVAAWDPRNVTSKANRTRVEPGKPSPTLHAAGMSIAGPRLVRGLTPTECLRLQGFPDGWTVGEADSARYRMLGNAVAVPVAEWIARRILTAKKAIENSPSHLD